MPNPAPAASMYAGIKEAKTDTRFPFLNEPGRYLAVIIGWRGQKNQSQKFADVTDFEVVKTFRGTILPGEHRTRMRVQDQYGTWLSEIKARAVTMLTIANNGTPVDPASVDVDVLTAITGGNGTMFRGMPVIVEVMPTIETKTGKEFSVVNYFVPTAADLEGVE